MAKPYSVLLLFLISTLLYIHSLSFDFAYDDVLQITQNPQVSERTLENPRIGEDFLSPTPPGNLYRPLTTLTYKVTWLIFGDSPFPFHATNIFLYSLTSVLVYFLFLAITKNEPLSCISTLVFIVHTLHVEVIANIIGRAELLSTFLGLAALLWFLKAPLAPSPVLMTLHSFIAGLLFLFAMLSKESALTLLPLIPFAAYLALEHRILSKKERFLRIIPGCSALLGSAVIALFLRYTVLGEKTLFHAGNEVWVENPLAHLNFNERLVPGLYLLGTYLQKLFLPLELSADYSIVPERFFGLIFSLQGLLTFLLLTATTIVAYCSKTLQIKFFFLWFIITFALTINIFFPIGTLMGDRLTFLPSIGFIGFISLIVRQYVRSPFILNWVVSLYIAVLTVTTYARIPVWQNNSILFRQTVLDNPSSPKSHYNLCVEEYLQEHNLDTAYLACSKAYALFPKYVLPVRLLSEISLKKKEFGSLELWYRRLLVLTPEDKEVQDNLEKLLNWKEQIRKEQK